MYIYVHIRMYVSMYLRIHALCVCGNWIETICVTIVMCVCLCKRRTDFFFSLFFFGCGNWFETVCVMSVAYVCVCVCMRVCI